MLHELPSIGRIREQKIDGVLEEVIGDHCFYDIFLGVIRYRNKGRKNTIRSLYARA